MNFYGFVQSNGLLVPPAYCPQYVVVPIIFSNPVAPHQLEITNQINFNEQQRVAQQVEIPRGDSPNSQQTSEFTEQQRNFSARRQ